MLALSPRTESDAQCGAAPTPSAGGWIDPAPGWGLAAARGASEREQLRQHLRHLTQGALDPTVPWRWRSACLEGLIEPLARYSELASAAGGGGPETWQDFMRQTLDECAAGLSNGRPTGAGAAASLGQMAAYARPATAAEAGLMWGVSHAK